MCMYVCTYTYILNVCMATHCTHTYINIDTHMYSMLYFFFNEVRVSVEDPGGCE